MRPDTEKLVDINRRPHSANASLNSICLSGDNFRQTVGTRSKSDSQPAGNGYCNLQRWIEANFQALRTIHSGARTQSQRSQCMSQVPESGGCSDTSEIRWSRQHTPLRRPSESVALCRAIRAIRVGCIRAAPAARGMLPASVNDRAAFAPKGDPSSSSWPDAMSTCGRMTTETDSVGSRVSAGVFAQLPQPWDRIGLWGIRIKGTERIRIESSRTRVRLVVPWMYVSLADTRALTRWVCNSHVGSSRARAWTRRMCVERPKKSAGGLRMI